VTDGRNQPLANARTRLVGNRTGFIAEAVIAVVRALAATREFGARISGRVASVITPLGWTYAALVPVSFVFGYVLGWVELVVFAWAGLVLIIVAGIYLIGRAALQIELTVTHSRVTVGDRAICEVVITNPGRRRVLGTTVEIPVGNGIAAVTMPSLKGGSTFVHEFAVPTGRRGIVGIGPVRTVRADPIGLVRRELIWTATSGISREARPGICRTAMFHFMPFANTCPGMSVVTSTGNPQRRRAPTWCGSSRRPAAVTSSLRKASREAITRMTRSSNSR